MLERSLPIFPFQFFAVIYFDEFVAAITLEDEQETRGGILRDAKFIGDAIENTSNSHFSSPLSFSHYVRPVATRAASL